MMMMAVRTSNFFLRPFIIRRIRKAGGRKSQYSRIARLSSIF